MANNNMIVREERSFPVRTQARIQIMMNNKAQLTFPRGATLSPARTEFSDEADLLAYLKSFFPIVGSGGAGRMSVRRKGKYQRVDSRGRPILTFGDPVLDLITDPDGRVRVGGTVHDVRALLSSGRIALGGNNPGVAAGALPLALAGGTQDTVDYTDGSFRMRFHVWRSNDVLFWKMGAEIETWGENFVWARIDSQYGEPVGQGGTVGGVLCGVDKEDSDEAAGDSYVNEYEWGTIGSTQPASVRSMCSAVWRGQPRQHLVQAGEGCQMWIGGPPVAPPIPGLPPVITWTPNVTVPNQQSSGSPALAAFNDRLHMVHLGSGAPSLWHSMFDGTNWTPNVQIPNQSSMAAPALAAFNGKLHMVHLGNGTRDIWHSMYDGTRWTPDVRIPDQSSMASPALAAFNGKLHMVHLGNGSRDIWHSMYDGTRWTPDVRIPDQLSKASPAIAAFGAGLHMVHLGDSSNNIWYSVFNGTSWSTNVQIPGQLSKSSPALGALNGRLYMVHLGDSSNDIWQSVTAGAGWSVNTRIPNQQSKAPPALAEFRGSLHMVHLGDSSNNIWYSRTSG